MYKSVVTKLWLAILAIIMTTLIVFSMFLTNRLETIYFSYQVNQMKDHALQWKNVIEKGTPPDEIQKEMEFWGKVSHYHVAVFNETGVAEYSSDVQHFPLGEKSNWHHIRAGIENKEAFYTGYNPEMDIEMTATFLSFVDQNNKRHVIMIHAPTQDLKEMTQATRSVGFLVLILFLIISGPLAWYFSKLIAKPLMEIRKAALNIAKGDFSTLVETNRSDELGDLAKTINIMSIRLKNTLNSLSGANAELTGLLHKWKEFVADVSHELRTPLFLIQGYSEALIDEVNSDEKSKKEYLQVINKETTRLQKLVNDLLSVESGIPLNRVPVNFYHMAKEIVRTFEIKAQEKEVEIQIDTQLTHFNPINADLDKLGEVIYNLVDNALRYTPTGGKIIISGFDSPTELNITVSDTGAGIAEEHLPYLFDRFYRVDKARNRKNGGTGLGLAIVKKIIDQHHGEITVKSQVGNGTVFKISLPREA